METNDLIRRSLDESTVPKFERRVGGQADFLKNEVHNSNLDNPDFTIGLEIEVYAVDDDCRLAHVPSEVYGDGVNKELGLHNAEINTAPSLLSTSGLEEQANEIRNKLESATEVLESEGVRLVFDSMWTIPPEGGSLNYFSEVEEREELFFATNMRNSSRYHAIDNYFVDIVDNVTLNVPGAKREFPSILFESLATSIQPHLQIPNAGDLPNYYNAAIRTMGPLLALSTNSPFLPPDLYNRVDNPIELTDKTYHELRVPVFEQAVNISDEYGEMKVRFPRDIESTEEVIEKVVDDTTYSPFLREWVDDEDTQESYTDAFWEFEFKRGTYWRWLRAVIGGDPVGENDEKSIRIEYRPLPTQPSLHDVVSLQALVSGLIVGLAEQHHPINGLDWEKAYDSFYGAVHNGLDAELHWVTEEGKETTDHDTIYNEIFKYATLGLKDQGLAEETIDSYFEPLRRRFDEGVTPSKWKIEEVRTRLESGETLEDAVYGMQRRYISNTEEYENFAEWI